MVEKKITEKLKIAVLLNAEPLPESYDIGKDGMAIEKRLVVDLSAAEAKAVAEAKKLQPQKVTALTYGYQEQTELLKKALALGADEAIHIGRYDWAVTPDPAIIAEALKEVIGDYDVLIMADSGSSLCGSEISVACAFALGWSCFNGIMSYKAEEKAISLKRKLEDGKRQEVSAVYPVVIGVLPDKEYCPYYTLAGKMTAEEKGISVYDISYSMLAKQLGIGTLVTDYWQKDHLKPQTKLVWRPDSKLSGAGRLQAMITGEVETKHGIKAEGSPEQCAEAIIKYLLDNNFIAEA